MDISLFWIFNNYMAVCQNLVPLVNPKIAGKWMFIPLKMVLIGIDPYPYMSWIFQSLLHHSQPATQAPIGFVGRLQLPRGQRGFAQLVALRQKEPKRQILAVIDDIDGDYVIEH